MCLCAHLHLIGMCWRLEPKEMSSKNLKIFIRFYNLVHAFSKIQRNENYLWCLLLPRVNSWSLLSIAVPLSFGEGNGNPLQYSCLEKPMGRGAWQAGVYEVTRAGHDLATKPPPAPLSFPDVVSTNIFNIWFCFPWFAIDFNSSLFGCW